MGNLIKVVLYNNVKKDYVYPAPTATVGEVLQSAGWDAGKTYQLNGETLVLSDMSRTLADFGYDGSAGRDTAYISAVTPKNNA